MRLREFLRPVLLVALTLGAAATLRAQGPVYVNTDPALNARLNLPVPANKKLPTLFLVGDSTVRNGRGDGANNQMGWGEPLVAFFDTVIFQWGPNDEGKPDDPTRARASLPGYGDETVEIENPILKRHETVHTYGWYMTQYVNDTLAKGATPIICSPIPRKTWKDGHIVRNKDKYGGWARHVAEAKGIGFIDLNEIIARQYDQMGEAAVDPLFGDPHTHTSLAGAKLNAASVVAGLKGLAKDPVAADFSPVAAAIPAYHDPDAK